MKEIPLTRGLVALVDDEDFDRVNQFKWYASKHGAQYYAARMQRRPDGSRTQEYLHNFILGVKGVDHRDGEGLNDCRQNLRAATQAQNSRATCRKAAGTTSQYRGVGWYPRSQEWQARIKVNYQGRYLGRFAVEEDAARAYDAAARELFGEFASPNFP